MRTCEYKGCLATAEWRIGRWGAYYCAPHAFDYERSEGIVGRYHPLHAIDVDTEDTEEVPIVEMAPPIEATPAPTQEIQETEDPDILGYLEEDADDAEDEPLVQTGDSEVEQYLALDARRRQADIDDEEFDNISIFMEALWFSMDQRQWAEVTSRQAARGAAEE